MNNQEPIQKRRIPFSSFEDQIILSYVKSYGLNNWKLVSTHLVNRTARQCKDRFYRYLLPSFNNGEWTIEEEDEFFRSVFRFQQSWKQIQMQFPKRNEKDLKKKWKDHILQKKSPNHNNEEEVSEYQILFKWAFS
jgi:hypothetical protein